ncbi:MAG: hypothetical protein ACYC35_05740 [Pirellulales bacterium]
MKRTMTLVAVLAVVGSLAIVSQAVAQAPGEKAEKVKLRVGTFDSRAVAVAYARSEPFKREIAQLMQQHKEAKAAGNAEKVKQLEAEGEARQKRLHIQGFSTGSVDNILAKIKDQLPAIAKEAGVDVLVSKWDVVYQTPTAECVDVTARMLKPFHPDEATLRTVEELKKHAPISLEEAENIKD